MYLPRYAAVALVLVAGPSCATALADGGQVRVSARRGDYQITVFTSPNPLRAGPVDVSVFVQDAKTGDAVHDVETLVELTARDGARPPISAAATSENATNKLFRAAAIKLPTAGWWDARLECATPRLNRPLEVRFAMQTAPPLPRWLSVWPWFCWPIAVVLLFAIHRALVARRRIHTASISDVRHGSPAPPRTLTPTAS